MTEAVLEIVEGSVSTITINRPSALNALNPTVLQALIDAIESLEGNPSVRVIVLTGAGEKSFVAGADIRAMADFSSKEIESYIELGQRAMQKIQTCKLPVVAMVNGFALGGGLELALACDFIVAADTARVGLPEVSLGILPGFGGTQRLIERAGIGVAKRMVLVGDMVGAQVALTLGIVDQVCPFAELGATTRALAETIAKRGPRAVQAAKQVINCYAEELRNNGLKQEIKAFMNLFETDDRKEGMRAFLEKREATFIGK